MTKTHASKPAILYQLLPKTVTTQQGVGVWQQIETYWLSNSIPASIPTLNWPGTVTNLETRSAGNKGYQNSGALFALQAATGKAYGRFVAVFGFLKNTQNGNKGYHFHSRQQMCFLPAFTLIVTMSRKLIVCYRSRNFV
jgi:hypothetical protein